VSVDGIGDDELVDVEDLPQGGHGAFGGFVEPHPHEPLPVLGCRQGELQVGGFVTRSANPPGPRHLGRKDRLTPMDDGWDTGSLKSGQPGIPDWVAGRMSGTLSIESRAVPLQRLEEGLYTWRTGPSQCPHI